jgi:hypothetical protein
VQCLSNLRQIGGAMVIYLNQSKGMLPIAPKNASNDYDAWYYRTTANPPSGTYAVFDNIQNSPIGADPQAQQQELQAAGLSERLIGRTTAPA